MAFNPDIIEDLMQILPGSLPVRIACPDDTGQYGEHQTLPGTFPGVRLSFLPGRQGRAQEREPEKNPLAPYGNPPFLPFRDRTWRPQQDQRIVHQVLQELL